MSQLSIAALRLTVSAIEQGLLEHDQYPQLLTIRDGVIQRFKITMDLSQKIVVRVLKDVFGLVESSAKKDTFLEAAKLGLVADAEAWLGHIAVRNRASHTYDSAIADQVFAHVPAFLPDARDLLKRLAPHVA